MRLDLQSNRYAINPEQAENIEKIDKKTEINFNRDVLGAFITG
jgi:hypothetical protein